MTIYLSLGANQIQAWLAQTPQLALMRGASKLLHFATSRTEIARWLAETELDRIAGCADAGDVDGVVALTVASAGDVPRVAGALREYLTDRMLGLSWSGWWVDAPSYVAAVRAAKDTDSEGVGRLQLIPHLQDVGLIQSCQECRREPATFNATGRKAMPGLGCKQRKDESDAGRDAWADIPGQWPRDFTQLAREGGMPPIEEGSRVVPPSQALGRRESRNHLATIVADGDNVGAVFDVLRRSALDLADLERSAAELLNTTMPRAVHDAALTTGSPAARVKVVIPHYVGGDDVTLSVPAPQGWQYAAALGIAFDAVRDQLAELLTEDPVAVLAKDAEVDELRGTLDAMSLGIGICFAHASHPFADAYRRADEAMVAAKRATNGKRSAIGWVDPTVGAGLGPNASFASTGSRDDVRVVETTRAAAELAENNVRPPAVFALPPSARAVLWDLLRSASDEAAAAEAVGNWDTRMGRRLGLDDNAAGAIAALPGELSRARWWPAVEQEEP